MPGTTDCAPLSCRIPLVFGPLNELFEIRPLPHWPPIRVLGFGRAERLVVSGLIERANVLADITPKGPVPNPGVKLGRYVSPVLDGPHTNALPGIDLPSAIAVDDSARWTRVDASTACPAAANRRLGGIKFDV